MAMALSYALVAEDDVDYDDQFERHREKYLLPECSEDRCYDQVYADGLCKNHHDLRWYQQGCPPVTWRTEKTRRVCAGCGSPIFNPHPRAMYCSSRCGTLTRVRRMRGKR